MQKIKISHFSTWAETASPGPFPLSRALPACTTASWDPPCSRLLPFRPRMHMCVGSLPVGPARQLFPSPRVTEPEFVAGYTQRPRVTIAAPISVDSWLGDKCRGHLPIS
jgi:hypothetical protein